MNKTYIEVYNEQKKEILELYNKGLVYSEIKEKLNLPGSISSLGEYLRNQGLKRINKQKSLIKDFKEDVIIPWQNGKSLTQLGKELHTCPKRLSKDLQSLGYNIHSKTFEKLFDNTVFDVIDTEEKAYWLGFIYADGYIETESNRFGIGISIKDYGHLVKFNSFMKYLGNNIKTKISKQKYKGELKEKEICFWRVSDKHLKESLIKQGCFEKKSLILEFPKIPAKLVKHFIRGYFDGDGCVSYYQNKTYISPQCSIAGTFNMLENIQFNTNQNSNIYKCYSSNIYYSIKYNKKGSEDFLNYIYDNSNIYLDRKYERYKLFKKYNFKIPYTELKIREVFGIFS